MGIEPFLIASPVIGVLAQRLVRVICPKCKTAAPTTDSNAGELALPSGATLFHGAGCASCKQGGYKGRVGVYELLPMMETVKNLVVTKAAAHAIRDVARQSGMRTLREDGIAKALAGITTVEEVLRVTHLE
jgi:type II secretory ATPase GspE/PulE/Tfp pilus assembly ATPase PilB-like protein